MTNYFFAVKKQSFKWRRFWRDLSEKTKSSFHGQTMALELLLCMYRSAEQKTHPLKQCGWEKSCPAPDFVDLMEIENCVIDSFSLPSASSATKLERILVSSFANSTVWLLNELVVKKYEQMSDFISVLTYFMGGGGRKEITGNVYSYFRIKLSIWHN